MAGPDVPGTFTAPAIATMRRIRVRIDGCLRSASATFVSGPSVRSVTGAGESPAARAIRSGASRRETAPRAGWRPAPSLPAASRQSGGNALNPTRGEPRPQATGTAPRRRNRRIRAALYASRGQVASPVPATVTASIATSRRDDNRDNAITSSKPRSVSTTTCVVASPARTPPEDRALAAAASVTAITDTPTATNSFTIVSLSLEAVCHSIAARPSLRGLKPRRSRLTFKRCLRQPPCPDKCRLPGVRRPVKARSAPDPCHSPRVTRHHSRLRLAPSRDGAPALHRRCSGPPTDSPSGCPRCHSSSGRIKPPTDSPSTSSARPHAPPRAQRTHPEATIGAHRRRAPRCAGVAYNRASSRARANRSQPFAAKPVVRRPRHKLTPAPITPPHRSSCSRAARAGPTRR